MERFGRELPDTVNPMWLLRTLPNNVLCHVGIRHGLKGPNACITNHSVSGMLAVIEGALAMREGEAQRVVAVGHDAPIEPQTLLYYHRAGLVAQDTLRPFDARHDGSLLGEGAAALVLETEASAAARGATVLGEYLGGGDASDGEGIARDPRRRRRPGARHRSRARRCRPRRRRRRHGRRARQRHAAIRRVRGRRAAPRLRRRDAAGHRIQVGDRSPAGGVGDPRRRGRPGSAAPSDRPRRGDLRRPPPRAATASPVSSAAQAPRSDVVLVVCRGFGGTNAALLLRAAAAA